jgi:hypothetical protein
MRCYSPGQILSIAPQQVFRGALGLVSLAFNFNRICQAADPLEFTVKLLRKGLQKGFAGGVRPVGHRINSGELSFVVAVDKPGRTPDRPDDPPISDTQFREDLSKIVGKFGYIRTYGTEKRV